MRKGKQILVIILASLMVLTMGGTWLSGALNSYAAGSGTSDNAATAKNTDAKESSEEVKKDDSSKGGSDVQTNQTDAGSDTKTEPKLVQRDIIAEVQEDVLYETVNNKKKESEALERVNSFISALTGNKAELGDDSGKKREAPVAVTVSGELPEDVTAEASYIEFAKPDKDDTSAENVLYAVDITLRDADGNVYTPAGPLVVSIKGSDIKEAADNEKHLLVYSYEENAERSEKLSKNGSKDSYAADSLVYKENGTDNETLLYKVYDRNKEYKDNEDAVRFAEDKEGLSRVKDSKDSAVSFKYSADWSSSAAFTDDGKVADKKVETAAGRPAHFVLSVQKSAEELKKLKEEQNKEEQQTEEQKTDEDKAVTEEKAEDEKSAEQAADEKPEAPKDRKLTASDDKSYKVTLKYSDEANLPEGAKLVVKELKGLKYRQYRRLAKDALDAEKIEYARIFDITIVDENGTEYQPEGEVDVSIDVLNEKDTPDSLKVVHFDAKKNTDLVSSETDEGTVSFATDRFSVYALIGVPQCTYTFYEPGDGSFGYKEYPLTDSEGRTIYNQVITSGDELVVPQLTSTVDEAFAGWYKGEIKDGKLVLDTDPYDFDNITITENSAVDLYAVYTTYATVTFHGQYDNEKKSFPVAYTRRGALTGDEGSKSAKVKITDLSVPYTSNGGPNMAFFGWSETEVKTPGTYEDEEHNSYAITPDEDGYITIIGDMDLYPVFREAHRLTYYAAKSGKGADYVPPANYFSGDAVPAPLPTTAMDGYKFIGWWTGTLNGDTVNYGSQVTNADGSLVSSVDDGGVYISGGKLYLRSDATLYARWDASTEANYKIIVWTQNPSDTDGLTDGNKNYVYRESDILSGTIGKSVSVPPKYTSKSYSGYHYSRCDAAKEITADGKMVLNVYYDKESGYTPSGTYTLTIVDSITEEGKGSKDLPKEYTGIAYGDSIADKKPAKNPTSGRNGYDFSNWYLDPECTIEANFSDMTMPDHDLTIYAGWETGWYIVTIDPNYGALYAEEGGAGTGATWFWASYEGESIGEYTQVTRDYVESSSGTWYYVYHGGDGKGGQGGWSDRYTYYTQDPGKATEDKTFEYAPGTYTYIGWYEVYMDEDGNEIGEASEPYDFTQHVDHNTKLRLHWKKAGTYYLAYAAGEGTLDDGRTKELLMPDGYDDYGKITLTKSANAPSGYTFIGWQVRGSSDTKIYTPGQALTLHGDDAKRVSGKDIIYLDAVYVKVDTASVIYDANGGSVAESGVDFGQIPDGGTGGWRPASGTIDTASGTATVSGLSNNIKFKLSSGRGFTAPQNSGAEFLGWSDKAVCDDSAKFYDKTKDEDYGVNAKEPKKLYAVWSSRVSFNLNAANAEWKQDEWQDYSYDKGTNSYYKDIKLGNAIAEPAGIPDYTGTEGRVFRYWATRTGSGTDQDPYVFEEYDFSQPVTGELDLYAYWSEPNTIEVHAVDSSAETLVDKTGDVNWTVNDITTTTTGTSLNGSQVTPPASGNYEFAFAAVSTDMASISEDKKADFIKYDSRKKCVVVKCKGESEWTELEDEQELYFVFYQKKARAIGYKSMGESGELTAVTTTGTPPATTGSELLGEYDISEKITNPLDYVTDFTNYSFAIGSVDTGAPMNASDLSLITDAADSDDTAPELRIRNTWRGFQYTTEKGDDAEWISCGYDPQLYVVYYKQTPTVVMFHEKTVGASSVMDTPFTFDLKVTQTDTVKESVQRQKKNAGGGWENDGDPTVDTKKYTKTIYDSEGSQPYILKDGEANSAILFYSKTSKEVVGPEEGDYRNVTTTTTNSAQTAVIKQQENTAFSTKVKADEAPEEESRVYTCTADGSGGTRNVTFKNSHKSIPIEVHVAMVENDGTSGGIVQRDSEYRSGTASHYKFDLALDSSATILTELPQSSVFTGDTNTYAFGTVITGTGSEDSAITVSSMDVASVSYTKTEEGVYEVVLKDSDGNILGELGSNQIYYLYYPMPKIKYVKEAADGTLTDITGCLEDPETGQIHPSNSVTYSHDHITMNDRAVEQNESIEIPMSGFVISQSGHNFRMPPVLDDGLYERYLSYTKLGAGSGSAQKISDLDGSTSTLTMQLKVQNNTLQYSFDGTVWKDLPVSGTPTIYAIYDEKGYDFQISKTVDTSESGENPIFSDSSYTVTISSMAITKESYAATGAESATVQATPASGDSPGTITLDVKDGTKIRIKALGRGDYTIVESGNENYTLTARSGPIVGGSTHPMDVVDNSKVEFGLDTETRVDLTNSPKAICRIDNNYFYTLQSMIDYVEENVSTKTATAEMLTDYLMPAKDPLEVPDGFNITLTTADSLGHVAVITRTSDLAGIPMVTNEGTLTLSSLILEGNNIASTAPVIQNSGNLTIGAGAVVQNAVNNDEEVKGGAISATAGDITISGVIKNCSAVSGGAVYHSGNGTITVDEAAEILSNEAKTGDGGAIYLNGGTIKVSGSSSISGNEALSGKGGAIYAGNAVIEIEQGGSITNNKAKEGGAVYAETGTISISKTADNVDPTVTGNVATDGNGGAIRVGAGSVTVSGGNVANNKAESGNGGAIYADTATVAVSGTADISNNRSKSGGAVYAASGTVTVSGGTIQSNTAANSDGGGIYAGSGNVTMSGGTIQSNTAATGSGGGIYAGSGSVAVSGGSLSGNTAKTDGGAIYAANGSVTLSTLAGGTPPVISDNTATDGNGGAICADSGAVSITGTTLTGNTAGNNGGAVYNNTGAVSATSSTFGGNGDNDGNTAGRNGGAIYAHSGNVTLSGSNLDGNRATSGSGGAVYAGSGVVNVSDSTSVTNNSADSGNGGALYVDSGSATLASTTATGNTAINGAAVFINTGRATFDAGSYTGNISSNGGAIGVGNVNSRLYFTGNVSVRDNKMGSGDDAPKSNVYLDQDDDAVINIDTLGSGAAIGIYVPDSVVNTRSVPGARFAVYNSESNVSKITNDRYATLTVQMDKDSKKLFWGSGVRIEVCKKYSYSNGLPNGTQTGRGTSVKDIGTYYPTINEDLQVAISELASDVYSKNSDVRRGLTATATYGGAFYYDAPDYGYDISNLKWNKNEQKWQVIMRNGQTEDLGTRRIYIIYAEPAYISIENNTEMPLDVSRLIMTVNGTETSVIKDSSNVGYGMVFAKNGAIRSALLPVTADDLNLAMNTSINLLIPGGQGMAYKLYGFKTTLDGNIRLRRGAEGSTVEERVTYPATGELAQLTGNTLSGPGTYHMIFGDDKIICKVVDKDGVEHPYSKISLAIADIKNGVIDLKTPKTAKIEMVTDYLLPASDHVLIPRGYDITLTTAAKAGTQEGGTYPYTGESEDGRAVISRDSENTESMIDAWNDANGKDTVNSLDGTTFRLSNLVLDGKSVRGSSDGGALKSKYVNVYVDTVDFKNVYASNGGAMLIMFSAKDKNKKATVKDTVLEVKNSNFTGCTSTTTETSNRLGGGAIVTNAETMTLENCTFDTCTAVDQAGAVFHRVDDNYNSWTNVTGCRFTNCSANAAGGLELDSKTITVTDTVFEHCVATQRNGGGFNVYALNAATPTVDCWVTVSGCTFNDCQLTTTNTSNGNGGGFRSNAVYTKVENSTFTNNLALYGGGFCISNGNAKKGEVYGCTFERNTASQGGGIFGKPYEFVIGDGYYYLDSDNKPVTVRKKADGSYEDLSGVPIVDEDIINSIQTRHSEIKNCTSKNEGGGLYHDKNANNTSLTITSAVITGNQTTNNGKNGGGVFTNCRKVEIDDSTISDNSCTSNGGGVYAYSYTSLTINDSDISRNTASGNGGGVWFDADDANRGKLVLTIKGSTIDGNTSNGNGGGIYTLAKTVTIGASETKTDTYGNPIRSSVSNNTSKTGGGGIYQSRNVDGSKLSISDTNVNGNTATNGAGGGIYAGVRTLSALTSEFSRNRASGDGGGIWLGVNETETLNIEGCTLNTNTSGGNGGSIYTLAINAEVKAHTEGTGESIKTTVTSISNSTAAKNGGGIYQRRDAEGSMLTVSGSVIEKNEADGTGKDEIGGGGIYTNAWTMTLTDSEVKGNIASKHGGGICKNSNGNNRYLIIDHSKVQNNTAGGIGGGVYDVSQLWLKNNVEITGNRLTTNNAADCAGVYLIDGRTLYVGVEGLSKDTVIVKDNTTANGTLSDLRLWEDKGENKNTSVYVYCDLSENSEIYVVNAAKAGTWFGSSEIESPDGFSDDFSVFKADDSTLHGIIDRNDDSKKKIVWAGPPIVKITDGEGKLLYLKTRTDEEGHIVGTSPAIFDRLGTGNNSYSTAAAFNMFCGTEIPQLYYANGTPYDGSGDYCIKMLLNFETPVDINIKNVKDKNAKDITVTFTTAGKDKDKEDGYPYTGSGTRATVTRGNTVNVNRSTLNAYGNLTFENIVLDGGSQSGVTPAGSTRCLWVEGSNNTTVILGENALLQNGTLTGTGKGGGGAYIQNGTLEIKGGVIRNCEANNGGGIFENNGTLKFEAGSIYQCSASADGGGVYQNNGSFTMSGGSVSGGSAAKGGGVFVVNGKSFNMSGGSIVNNNASSAGGGIAIGGNGTRLYFSHKVNISGNTCDASETANKACNVELDQNSKAVINTNNGGLYSGSYIGVYVLGNRNDDDPEQDSDPYKSRGGERDAFGTFANGDNTNTFYSFVNDRNGLKGGIIENPDPNTIYWIKIFSLTVSKEVISGDSTSMDEDEQFLFKVNLRGRASSSGQPDAKDIDSDKGDYGEMHFKSNNVDTTTAIFALKSKEGENTISGVNLSEGLEYEVIEYLIVSGGSYDNQHKRYASMPMKGSSQNTETIVYDGNSYTVVKANMYSSNIGENKERKDVDPYTSAVKFTNLMPVCKITDTSGNLLYRRYYWDKVTNNKDEVNKGEGDSYTDGPDIEKQKRPYYYAPAVFTELTGEDGAFAALNDNKLYTSNGSYPTRWDVSNGVQIKMLIADYKLKEPVAASQSKVTLTTAGASDLLFPKQDRGTTSTINRTFEDSSMFTVSGDLTLNTIILDGAKSRYTIAANGGVAAVPSGGKLTIQEGATLQNSKTGDEYKGGAVFAESGGTVTMTGGTINRNESNGDGAGIYLSEGSIMYISGNPNFGGTGIDVSGNIKTTDGNFRNVTLTAQRNGGKSYTKPRQDIFIAGYSGSDGDHNAASLVVNGNISSEAGSIWVWAEKTPHFKTLQQFAVVSGSVNEASCNAFRNAQPDDTSENETDEYLFGTLEGDTSGYVYWSGISGLRRVILRKVDSDYKPAQKTFTVYRGTGTSAYTPKGSDGPLESLTSGASGCIWIGELPYGWYIVKENNSGPYFYIVVTESGVYGTLNDSGADIPGGYQTRNAAQNAAQKKYNDLK